MISLDACFDTYALKGRRLLVGLSGGVDSVCLLHVLHLMHKRGTFILQALHCDHGLRGRESREDALFCQALCERLGIPFHLKKRQVKRFALNHGFTVEEGARIFRYQSFESVMKKEKLDTLVLAHHADDLLETILFRLFRGTHLGGIRCMETLEQRKGYTLFRPFLKTTKSQLMEYSQIHGLACREDGSNLMDIYTRNAIRHKVVPVLKEVFPETFPASILGFREYIHEHQEGITALFESTFAHANVQLEDVLVFRLSVLKPMNAYMLCEYIKHVLKKKNIPFMLRHHAQAQEIYQLTQTTSGKQKRIHDLVFFRDTRDLCLKFSRNTSVMSGGLTFNATICRASHPSDLKPVRHFETWWQHLIQDKTLSFSFNLPQGTRWRCIKYKHLRHKPMRQEVLKWFKAKRLPRYLHDEFPVMVSGSQWAGSPGLGWKPGLTTVDKEEYMITFTLS